MYHHLRQSVLVMAAKKPWPTSKCPWVPDLDITGLEKYGFESTNPTIRILGQHPSPSHAHSFLLKRTKGCDQKKSQPFLFF